MDHNILDTGTKKSSAPMSFHRNCKILSAYVYVKWEEENTPRVIAFSNLSLIVLVEQSSNMRKITC